MTELAAKQCKPCQGDVTPLTDQQIAPLLSKLDQWNAVNNHHLQKVYKFPDFVSALKRVNAIGEIAEQEGHHPNLFLTWGEVKVEIWTHKIDGLTESDFILAAKLDQL